MKTIMLVITITVALMINACDVVDAPYLKNPIDPADTLLKDTSSVVVSLSLIHISEPTRPY